MERPAPIMKHMKTDSETILAGTIRRAFGLDGLPPLGGCAIPLSPDAGRTGKEKEAVNFLNRFFTMMGDGDTGNAGGLCLEWSDSAAYLYEEALKACGRAWAANGLDGDFESGDDAKDAMEIARLWAPEIGTDRGKAEAGWRLTRVRPCPEPVRPEQVLLQLNGLYTLPSAVSPEFPGPVDPGAKIADYDHPVPLYEADEAHELVSCLAMLERDIAFEKASGVLPENHRVPVLLSVSVTHDKLDAPVTAWLQSILRKRNFSHIRLLLLTEAVCRRLDRELFDGEMVQFGVSGAYGRHFTALKYCALLCEKSLGVRASFKLDTDEAICSEALKEATGKTWFETLCHDYWGGTAEDSSGRKVYLGVNEGEYVNGSDIETLGYAAALRTPDVRPPASALGRDLFFQKGFAHGNATAWYNGFDRLEDFISHPVVKGGGYGITNDGLRKALPFTWSRVGRAEDQQFYFSALAGGVRAIFHPDLRIAHYKGAVAVSENRTEATRFAGDMYRIVQFAFLARRFGVKPDLDPMPGVFAGELARAQAFFQLLHRAAVFFMEGKRESAMLLLEEGLETLAFFERFIDSGEAEKELTAEAALWKRFVERSGALDPVLLERVIESCFIERYP